MNRRSFLFNLAYATGGAALAFGGLGKRAQLLAETNNSAALRAYGFGALSPQTAKNTGELFLSLPQGFQYNAFGKTGKLMSDGRETPPRHDGMAAFKVGKELRLVRNHEVTGGRVPRENFAIGSSNHYDETAGGGTTTLVIDPNTREIVRDFVSLSGTLINCAGGRTPWGSWISCEETTLGQTVITAANGTKTGGFKKPHGYCFEVPARANTAV